MAKIKHNKFIDTVNDIFGEAKKKGVLQLQDDSELWSGNSIRINDKKLNNFGTCGYMGLETHPTVIEESRKYLEHFGTQYSVSRTYLVSKQNYLLEEMLSEIFNNRPVIAHSSTTIAHMSVLPIVIGYNDIMILDQQVHMSIQTAAQLMVPKGVPIEMIRHSDLDMLEEKIKEVYGKYEKIWYMVDGVYSMFGDVAPMDGINQLMEKYPKLHLYIDDAHGMSWYGKKGCGRLFEKCDLNGRTVYITTMAKGYGAMGGISVFPDSYWYDKIILYGGMLAHTHPLPPPMLGAAIGSAKVHLSDEIYTLQRSLKDKLDYAKELFDNTNIPILSSPETPIFFLGTGRPSVGFNLNKRIIDDGYYVNIAVFPIVPTKKTGLRFTITNHNTKEQIKSFIETIEHHYPLVMREENESINNVREAFGFTPVEVKEEIDTSDQNKFDFTIESTIDKVDKYIWNEFMRPLNICDWHNMRLFEKAFSNNEKEEENWKFYYFIIKDAHTKKVILVTFFTLGVQKDDMLSLESISKIVEDRRVKNPYYLTSKTLSMGSLISEGDHLYIDKENPLWVDAFKTLLDKVSVIQEEEKANVVLLRDFPEEDQDLSEIVFDCGFAKMNMPNSNVVEHLNMETNEVFLDGLTKNGRNNIKRYVLKKQDLFDIEYKSVLTKEELEVYYQLYQQIKNNNFAVNIFGYPRALFEVKNEENLWEFIVLRLKETGEILAIGSAYKAKSSYCPMVIGVDYQFNKEYKTYKQMLYLAVKRAYSLGYETVNLGLTADSAKRDVGAMAKKRVVYFQAKDNYNMEVLENISN